MAQIRPLAPELAAVSQAELNENEPAIAEEIAKFRECLAKMPHLKGRTDDQFLVAFLRFCKYDLSEALKRFEYYYTYKTTAGDLLPSRQIDNKILSICRAGIFATLPKPVGVGGPRIHYTRMSNLDTSIYNVQDMFRFQMLRSEIEINTDDNWVISGVLEIIDFSKIPFAFLRQFEPGLFKKMAAFLEFGVPTNLKGTHIVNASREAQLILSLVRVVMKQKELLHIHSSVESLQQAIGKEYLPVELGGSNGTLDEAVAGLERLLLDYKDYFVEDEQFGVDEKLRAAEPTNVHITSPGAEGSFRRLNID